MRLCTSALALGPICVTLAGCPAPYFIASDASGALDCPEERVHVRRTSGAEGRQSTGRYVADGCGRSMTYTCVAGDCRAD